MKNKSYKVWRKDRWHPITIHTFVDPKRLPKELRRIYDDDLSLLFGPKFHFFFQTNISRYLVYKFIDNDPIHAGKLVHFLTCDSNTIFGDDKFTFFPLCRKVFDFYRMRNLIQNQDQLKFYEETLMAPDPAEIESYYRQIELQNEMNEDYNRTKRSLFSFGTNGDKKKGKRKKIIFVGLKTGKVLGSK